MTVEQTARQLDSAADELASMKAELAAAMEFRLDASGPGACEVLGKLNMAWSRHTELAGRLSAEVSGLAVAVRAAATAYREADESSSMRLQGEGGAAGGASLGVSGSAGVEEASGEAGVSVGGAARVAGGTVGLDGEAAASWGVAGSGGLNGDVGKEAR